MKRLIVVSIGLLVFASFAIAQERRFTIDDLLKVRRVSDPQVSPKGDWVAWVGKYDDIIGARQGQYRVRLMHNTKGADCAYPGVELLPDGTIVTTTYGHWTEGEQP